MKAAVKSTEAHAAWDENGSEAPIWSDPTTHRSQNDWGHLKLECFLSLSGIFQGK